MDFIDYMLAERLIATHDETKKYISPLKKSPKPSSYSLMCFQTCQRDLRKDWRFGVYDYFPKDYIAYFRMNPTAREDYIEARSNYRMVLCGTTPLGIEIHDYHPKVYDAFADFNAAYAEDISRFREWLIQYDEYLDDWSSGQNMFPPEYISYFTGNPQAMALWIAGVVTQKQIRKKERPSVMLGDSSGNPIKYGTPLAVFKDKYESIAIRH